jgi:uncharacterized protein (DUF885 family)
MGTNIECFNQLLSDDWDFRMRSNPTWATRTGDHRFDDKMRDASEAAAQRRLSMLKDFQKQANDITRDELGDADRLNYDIYTRLLDNDIRGMEFRSYRFPVSKLFGVQNFLPDMQMLFSFNTIKDYENYISRMRGIKLFMDQVIETMRAGLDDGQIPPRVTLEGVDESVASHIVEDPADSVFIRPFNKFPKSVLEKDRDELMESLDSGMLMLLS